MAELPGDVHDRISTLCAQGDERAEQEDYSAALKLYAQAWNLLPQPPEEWEAATWILAAIGDACFLAGDHNSALDALTRALLCPGAIGNPFIHLRLGEVSYERGNLDFAANELAMAYMGAGREIFENEDEKYLKFLSTRMKPPVGSDSL